MHRFNRIFLFVALAGLALNAWGQPLQKPRTGTFALENATLVTVTDGTIENATLVIADGRIAALGADVDVPDDAERIDCSGKFVYPGMIDGGTQLGLSEVGSVSLTQDYNEIGEVIPQMQALTAVNPNSVAIPVTRVNGVTSSLAVPTGGLFSGTAALIDLVGYNPDQMYAGFKGVVLRFPSSGRRGRWDRRSDEDIAKANERALQTLNDTWEEATLYAQVKGQPGVSFNAPLEALQPVINGDMALLVEVNQDKDILAALNWVREKDIARVIFTGVAEGWRVADSLAAAEIPVIAGPVLSTPTRASDRYDKAYANPGLMLQAGVTVALRTNETENVRNLPYNAGFAAAYGMGKEEALRAVTIVPAEIFGLADELGSLEVGKKANLFVADGDPFETKTQFEHIFIKGYLVPMDSRHIRLYDEFLERSPGLDE